MTLEILYAALLGYVLGAIPSGLWLTRLAGMGDIRDIGSGNIGATNVLRTGNKPIAAATLILDAAKAAAAVLLARYLWGEDAAQVAGLFALVGHVWTFWLQFKGGKGVAAMIGALLALNWPVGLIFCATWAFIAFVRKISSLAALTAASTAPIFAYIFGGWNLALVAGIMSVILFYSHRENIVRLLNETEPRIGS